MQRFKREVLLKSSEFEKYQKDFVAALLTKDEYTLPEARRIVKNFFEAKEEK